MKYLFKNQFKNLFRNRLKFFSLLLLITLSGCIFATMTNLFAPLKVSLEELDKDTKIEDFRLSFSPDYIQNELLKGNDGQLKTSDKTNQSAYFLENFSKKYAVILEKNNEKVIFQKNNGKERKYTVITEMIKMNTSRIISGRAPIGEKEVALNPQSLDTLNKKINDKMEVEGKVFTIVGTFARADHKVLGDLSGSSTITPKDNLLLLVTESTFDNLSGSDKLVYSGLKTSKNKQVKNELDKLYEDGDIQIQYLKDNEQLNALSKQISSTEISGGYFTILILIISVVMITIVLKRMLSNERKTVGVFKAQGYTITEITLPYNIYALFLAATGGLVGYCSGYFLANILRKSFLQYFIIPKFKNDFPVLSCVFFILLVLGLLIVTVNLATINVTRKKARDLLSDSSKSIKFKGKKESKTFIKSSKHFFGRLTRIFFIRNWKNQCLIIATIFLTNFLLLIACIQFSLPSQMINVVRSQQTYKYQLSYFTLQNNGVSENASEQCALNSTTSILKINDAKMDIKNIQLKMLDFSGVNYFKILNSKKENLKDRIFDSNVVISAFLEKNYGINVGDKINIECNGKTTILKVVDIVDDMSSMIYANLNSSPLAELTDDSYNTKYLTKKPKINSEKYQILSFNEYIDNSSEIANQLQLGSYSIALISVLLALIILNMLSNIIVEENRKNVSVFKLLGYESKEIRKLLFRLTFLTVVISSIITNMLCYPVFTLMENQLIQLLGAPAKIELGWKMNVLAILLTVCISYITQKNQERKLEKVSHKELLF